VWVQLDDNNVFGLDLQANVNVNKVVQMVFAQYKIPRCNVKVYFKGEELRLDNILPDNTSYENPIKILSTGAVSQPLPGMLY